jgi:hypothetical protein
MQNKLTCLSLAALLFASCDKSETKTSPGESSSKKPQVETRAETPAIAEKTTPAPPDSPAPSTIPNIIDPPLSYPVTAEMIRPAGTAPTDAPWETLTPEERIAKFNSSGIARIPKDISDKIIADAAKAETADLKISIISQQAAAWHHINHFKEDSVAIPDHVRMALLEKLMAKHGDAWINMVPELDEQVAASARVDELRANGIPGLSADESQDIIIKAIERYGADYKAILSVAERSAKK